MLRISENLELPDSCATWVFDFLAKRGAGKTYDAAVLCEEMIKAGIPVIVLDPMGVWWGLKSSTAGNKDGLPVVVFGGKHADLPLIPEKIPELVQSIIASNISAVLDLEDFSDYKDCKIVEAFAKELYRLSGKVSRHVFIEEADIYVPQKPISREEIMCKAAVDKLVRRGGNRNIGCSVISQRSAVVDKNVLSQADCLVALRTLSPQDKTAIAAWVENVSADKLENKKFYDSLKDLQNGEAYVWNPENGIFKRVMFRRRETLHATREYLERLDMDEVKTLDVDAYIQKFKSVFEQKAKVRVSSQKEIDEVLLQNRNLQKGVDELKGIVDQKDREIDLLKLELADARKTRPESKIPVPVAITKEDYQSAKNMNFITQEEYKRGINKLASQIDALSSSPDILLHADALKVSVDVQDKIREFSTTNVRGQIMRVMLELVDPERKGEKAPWAEIRRRAAEFGYGISDSGGNRTTISNLVSEASLINEGDGYRLPSKAEFLVVKE